MTELTPEKPYKFLDYYKLEDEHIFFGRKRETRILVADVVINRLVVLFAKTGTGKTSLINAGVRPNLNERGYETFFIRVSKDPEASARAILISEKPELSEIETLPFTEFLQQASKRLKKPIVLFFDQFEEFFIYIYGRDRVKAQQFISTITELYKNPKSNVHIVLSLREDFLAYMDAFRDKLPAILHNDSNLRLLWFDEGQAREAIHGPANKFGVEIEKALEDRLIKDLARDGSIELASPEVGGGGGWPTNAPDADEELRIEPAQLQIVCDTLWGKNRLGHKSITLSDYIKLGKSGYLKLGKAGAQENIARQILYRRLVEKFEEIKDKRQLEILEKLLPKLRIEQTKHVYEVSSLAKDLQEDPSYLRNLLQTLAASGLVRLQKIRDDIEVIELAHDYLVPHLKDLQEEVRKIWPNRVLGSALSDYQKHKKLISADDLKEISEKIHLLDFSKAQSEVFFRSALKSGKYIDLWFEKASAKGVKVWEILSQGIEGDDSQQHSYIRKLLVQLQTPEVFDLLQKTIKVERLRSRVEGALKVLAESDDREVASRAKSIIDKLPTLNPRVPPSAAAEREIPTVTPIEEKTRLLSSPESGVQPPYALISHMLRKGEVIPFLGGGINFGMRPPDYHWNDKTSSTFPPSSAELSRYLARMSSFPATDESDLNDLAKVAEYFVEVAGRRRLREHLHEILDHDFEPCHIHHYLASLPTPMLIVTTVFDDMLERAFRKAGHPYDLVVFPTDRSDLQGALLWWRHQSSEPEIVTATKLMIDLKQTTVIFKIFGSIDRAHSKLDSFVITEQDHLDFYTRMVVRTALPTIFMESFSTRSFLFLGYGLRDWPQRMLPKYLKSVRRIIDEKEAEDDLPSWAIQYKPSVLDREMWRLHDTNLYDSDLNEFAMNLQKEFLT